jgi:hypothetical protein
MPIGVIRRFYERVQDDDHVGIFGDIKAAVRRAAVNDQLDHASANGINKLLDSQSWFLVKLNPSQIFAEFILHIFRQILVFPLGGGAYKRKPFQK